MVTVHVGNSTIYFFEYLMGHIQKKDNQDNN